MERVLAAVLFIHSGSGIQTVEGNGDGAPRCMQTGHPRRRRMKAESGNSYLNLS